MQHKGWTVTFAGRTGSYNEAYLTAACVLVLAAGFTFVTRSIEVRHKERTAGAGAAVTAMPG